MGGKRRRAERVAHRAFEGEGWIIIFDCLRLLGGRREKRRAEQPRGAASRIELLRGKEGLFFVTFYNYFSDLFGLFRGDLPPWSQGSPGEPQGIPRAISEEV